MSLILPPSVAADLDRDRWAQAQHDYAKDFEREVLKPLDPNLELRFIAPTAPEEYDIVPGRWHVVYRNRRGPDRWIPVLGPKGEYIEPTSRILDQLQASDLHHRDMKDELAQRRYEEAKQRAKQKEEEREERVDEMAGRIKSAISPGVSLSRAGPWRYRASARRG